MCCWTLGSAPAVTPSESLCDSDTCLCASPQGVFVSRDIFREIVPVCERNEALIHYVFHHPAQVMGRFVLIIFHGRLQEHLQQVLVTAGAARLLREVLHLH